MFARKNVALYLGESDVALGKLAVGMEDRIERILPALIGETLFGCALILDEAVLIGIAGAIDPPQGSFDCGPEFAQHFVIAGPFDIKASEQHKQRR